MKTKTYITLIVTALVFLVSCSNNTSNEGEHEGHDEHENELPKGVVLIGKPQREALELKLGQIENRNLTTLVKTNGELEISPESKADITAFIGGNVKTINVFHGDKVVKGEALAVLEHPDFISLQENFAEVSSRLEFLENEYQRQKQLFENEVGSGKDFQEVKANYMTAKSRYNGLKARLEMLNIDVSKVKEGAIFKEIVIKSPISGFVSEVNIKVGSYIDAQTKMFSVSDNDDIHADFLVYENDIHLVKIGQKIDFTVANQPDKEISAEIFAIGQEFQDESRSVHIHAKFDSKSGNFIQGMYVSGHIHTDEISTKALPESAIVIEGTKSYIFIKDDSVLKDMKNQVNHNEHADEEHSDEEDHDHDAHAEENENDSWAFRMVEIISGVSDNGYIEVRLIDSIPADAQVVLNAAYYLLSDLKKSETKHEH